MDQDDKKYRREATKQLLIDLLKSVSGLTILLARPSGSMYNPKYFYTDGRFERIRFRRALRHSQKYDYIDVKEKDGELKITLKEAGHARALEYSTEDIHIKRQNVWDKKWRMVIFDIPEKMRPIRIIVKAKLDEMGFAQIQKSVYIHAFPCHNEIEYMRSLYSLQPYIRLALLDKLENDEPLRKRFDV